MSIPGMTPRANSGSSSAALGAAILRRAARIGGRIPALLRKQAIALGAVRVVVVCLVAWGVYAHEREMLRNQGERDAAILVRTSERAANHILADLDGALTRLAGRADRDGAAVNWAALFDEGSALVGQRAAFALFDVSGSVALGAAAALPEAERRALAADAGAGGAGLSVLAGEGRVVVARRLFDGGDRPLGVAAAVLDPASLIAAALDSNADLGVALVDRDGRTLAASGSLRSAIGQNLPLGQPLRGADATEPAALDDGRSGYAAEIADSPLSVVVTPPDLSHDPALSGWRNLCIVAAGVLSLLISASAYALALRATRYEACVAEQARRDPLTGLANRTAVHERLDQAFAAPTDDRVIALMVIDLDRFKYINDTHGHPVGDELLRVVAERLRALAGPDDLVGRLGGDEFAIVQPVAGYGDEAGVLALRVCRELAAPYELGSIHASVGASVGVAFAARDANATSELLKAADMALYAAKGQGRGAVRFFHPDMHHAVRRKVMIETGLRGAIKRDELHLVYQPIKNARDETTVGYEALLRWQFGSTMVPPTEFIAVAEEAGLIVPIGAWVLERACADMARVPAGLRVAVNCSPVQLESFDFAGHVRQSLDHFGLSADRLEIEVTESFLINDSPRIAAQLRRLKELGVRISLDDFGTGYSSLNCLDQYPFDSVKIDRSFVQKLERREQTRFTVRAIIELASSFGMTTIAEGIETRAQLAAVVELGCVEAQGYLFSEPKPLSEILALAALERPGVDSRRRGRFRLNAISQAKSGTGRSQTARRPGRRAASLGDCSRG